MSIVDAIFGQTTNKSSTAPWKPQQQSIKDGFQNSANAFDLSMQRGGPQGDPSGQYNTAPGQMAQDFGMNQAFQGGQDISQLGMSQTGQIGQAAQNAGNLYQGAGADKQPDLMKSAAQFAKNPYLDKQIDAVGNDMRRAFDTGRSANTANAPGDSGGFGSRAGTMDAQMGLGLSRQFGQISNDMRSNAWQNGLGMANDLDKTAFNQQSQANNQIAGGGQQGVQNTLAGLGQSQNALGSSANSANMAFQNSNTQAQQLQAQQQQQFQNPLWASGQYAAQVGGKNGGVSNTAGPSLFQSGLGAMTGIASLVNGNPSA